MIRGGDLTSPVSINYEDGTSDTWDGRSSINITKAATITINDDFTASGQIRVGSDDVNDFDITINGNDKTITADNTITGNVISLSNNKTTINNLKIKSVDRGTIIVGSDLEVNDCDFYTENGTVFAIDGDDHTLTINSGTYETKSVQSPNIGSSKTSNSTINIKGGTIKALDQIVNSAESTTLNISGGEFYATC